MRRPGRKLVIDKHSELQGYVIIIGLLLVGLIGRPTKLQGWAEHDFI